MTMQMVGVGAVIGGRYNSGLGRSAGLGIPGPFGDNPKPEDLSQGTLEISGTQVMLRDAPGGSVVSGAGEGFNGAYGQNNNIVAGAPDQVDFDGKTGSAQGLLWAHVTAKTGNLAGKSGFVAVKFLAPVGWTASHGGTGPIPSPQVEPTPETGMEVKKTNYVPWIIGGVVLTGLVVGGAIMAKKQRARRRGSPAPAFALEARRRRRRYR